MKGGRRVKLNVGEPKVNVVYSAAIFIKGKKLIVKSRCVTYKLWL